MFNLSKKRLSKVLKIQREIQPIVVAFQPIVDTSSGRVWGYEALTRGVDGKSYPELIVGMDERERASFDKMATARALREAARLGLTRDGVKLTVNVRPTVDRAAMDGSFLARAARHYEVPLSALVVELTEDVKLTCDDFLEVMATHRALGLATGIDDFGSGYSGLNVLATCGAEMVKLDRHLIRGVDTDAKRQIIVESFTRLCARLGSLVVAEGVETREEAETLRELGIELMQGYYFGRPAVGKLVVSRLEVGDGDRVRGKMLPFVAWSEPMRA